MKLLLYCCKSKKDLLQWAPQSMYPYYYGCFDDLYESEEALNGKIVAECDYEVEEIDCYVCHNTDCGYGIYTTPKLVHSKLSELSCLNDNQLEDYLGYHNGYAIHIKNLNIFIEPRELSDYCRYIGEPITKAPQNMMHALKVRNWSRRYVEDGYVREVRENKVTDYILISIRPEYLVEILNGFKTIEVRKKVLKEML